MDNIDNGGSTLSGSPLQVLCSPTPIPSTAPYGDCPPPLGNCLPAPGLSGAYPAPEPLTGLAETQLEPYLGADYLFPKSCILNFLINFLLLPEAHPILLYVIG